MENKFRWLARLFIVIIFVFCPFLSFLLSTLLLIKGIDLKFNILIGALCWGLYGYLFIPEVTMDITRHYEMYDSLLGLLTFDDFLFWTTLSDKPDYVMYYIFWIFGKIGFTSQIIGFFSAFIMYFMLYYLAYDISEIFNFKNSSIHSISYPLIFFLALTSPYWFSGIRQCNAIFLFIIALMSYYKGSYKNTVVFLLGSVFLHFSIYPFVILFLCAIFFSNLWINVFAFVLIGSSFFFYQLLHALSEVFLTVGGIGEVLSMKIDAYIFSGDGDDAIFVGPALRWYLSWILFFVSIPICYYINIKKSRLKSRFLVIHYFYILLLSYMIFTLSVSLQFFSRTLDLMKYLFFFYVSYLIFQIGVGQKMKKMLIGLLVVVSVGGIYSLFIGNEGKTFYPELLYMNLVDILETSVPRTMYWKV